MNNFNPTQKPGRKKLFLFSFITFLVSLSLLTGLSEIMVRMIIPKETFWPVSNIYRPSNNPNILYTYKSNFSGVAFGQKLNTNDLGFRGPNWSQEKPAHVFRIALIGDSHAFGYGVAFEDTVGEVLTKILSDKHSISVEVMNFGVNGFNSLQQEAVLSDIALNYDPSLVVILPANNDHQNALTADTEGWLHWDGDDKNSKSRMIDRSIEKTKVEDVFGFRKKSHLYLYFKLWQKRYALQNGSGTPRDVDTSTTNMTAKWMGEFSLGPISERLREPVYEPLNRMLTKLKTRQTPVVLASYISHLDYRQMLLELETTFSVPHVELLSLFPEAHNFEQLVEQFSLGWDNHLNAQAHKRWAEAIARLIDENSYVSTN